MSNSEKYSLEKIINKLYENLDMYVEKLTRVNEEKMHIENEINK